MSIVDQITAANIHSGNTAILTQPSRYTQQKEVLEAMDRLRTDKTVVNVNSALTNLQKEERKLNMDEDLNRLVVKIINANTKELVKQIPNEIDLELSRRMREMIGLLYGS
jgi:flagellar protein FlaG